MNEYNFLNNSPNDSLSGGYSLFRDNINLTNKTNYNTKVTVISDYEGQELPKENNTHYIICGDMLDSTVGGGGTSNISENIFGGHKKHYNIRNIMKIVNEPNKYTLIYGNRDINKFKTCPLTLLKIDDTYSKSNTNHDLIYAVNQFNYGYVDFKNKDEIKKLYINLINYKNNIKWVSDMNHWLPFWNNNIKINDKNIVKITDTIFSNNNYNYEWIESITENNSNSDSIEYPFLERFNRIFGIDGKEGTMSAQNLLYTIPTELDELYELYGNVPMTTNPLYESTPNNLNNPNNPNNPNKPNNPNNQNSRPKTNTSNYDILDHQNNNNNTYSTLSNASNASNASNTYTQYDTLQKAGNNKNITDKDKDYKAFLTLLAFRTMWKDKKIIKKNKDKIDKDKDKIDKDKDKIDKDKIDKDLYGLLHEFYNSKNAIFVGYMNFKDKLILFSHGGITSDIMCNFKDQIKFLETHIETNKERLTQHKIQKGGFNIHSSKYIIKRLSTVQEKYNNILKNILNDIDKITIPTKEMLLLLSLSAPYRPLSLKTEFINMSPINPGIDNVLANKFYCDDKKLIQVFGHVPKGYGTGLYKFIDNNKELNIINLDISQSYKYSGYAGKTDNKLNINYNGVIIVYTLIDLKEESKKKLEEVSKKKLEEVSKEINPEFERQISNKILKSNNIVIKNNLEELLDKYDEPKEEGYTFAYHGYLDNILIFSKLKGFEKELFFKLKDFEKELFFKNRPLPKIPYEYKEKYLKYKQKYLKLKNSL